MKIKRILTVFLLFVFSAFLFADFIVIGDVRLIIEDSLRRQPNPNFLENIQEINLLKPEAVFMIGDLVYGYDDRKEVLEEEWKKFQEAIHLLKVPYYLVPGNHEIFGEEFALELYKKYAGPTYWAQVVGNKLFIALNTEELGYEASLSPEEIKFLENTLEKYRDIKKKFILMHRPLWWDYEDHNLWMKRIHPLLLKYGVEAVFAGHYHQYEYREINGIKYIVTGGGGAEASGEELNGGFNHFVYVKEGADGDEYLVMGARGIFPVDFYTHQEREKVKNFLRKLSPVALPGKDTESVISFKNIFNKTLKFELDLQNTGNMYFTAAPEKVEFLLLPGETLNIPVKLRYRVRDMEELFPIPVLKIKATDEKGDLFMWRGVELRVPGDNFIQKLWISKPVKFTYHYNRRDEVPEIYKKKLSKKFLKKLARQIELDGKEIEPEFNHKFDLEKEVFPNIGVYAFLKIDINSDKEVEREAIIEMRELYRVYLNGELIYDNEDKDRYSYITLPLKKGKNTLIILAVQIGGSWTFRMALK